MKWWWISTLWIAATCVAEMRPVAVAYLKDLKQPAVQLKVLQRAPISLQSDRPAASERLPRGQKVELIGWGENLCYVAGRTATGPVRGWVATDALEQPPADVLEQLRKWISRRESQQELIAQHEVALEMTRDEVQTSLGKPTSRRWVTTAAGKFEEWRYPTYQYVPQYYQEGSHADGKLRQTVTYQRRAVGSRNIRFQNGLVVAIDNGGGAQPPFDLATPLEKTIP